MGNFNSPCKKLVWLVQATFQHNAPLPMPVPAASSCYAQIGGFLNMAEDGRSLLPALRSALAASPFPFSAANAAQTPPGPRMSQVDLGPRVSPAAFRIGYEASPEWVSNQGAPQPQHPAAAAGRTPTRVVNAAPSQHDPPVASVTIAVTSSRLQISASSASATAHRPPVPSRRRPAAAPARRRPHGPGARRRRTSMI